MPTSRSRRVQDFLPEIAGAGPDRPLRSRAAVSSTLIASLELARDGALALDQNAAWRPIRVMRRDTTGIVNLISGDCRFSNCRPFRRENRARKWR
jgi:chromatin segregation and condensation protein Rec8/ScpA/Scc1 (kleisin family)